MSAMTVWWIATGILVAAELATGTFYLLMLALGTAGAALAGHAGLALTGQLVVAALVGGGAVVAWHLRRARHPGQPPAERNPDVNLDVGQRVHVGAWGEDGTARVAYRGAHWAVRWSGDGPPATGELVIRAVHGAELQLGR